MNKFPFRTLVFDMDGTLLNAHNELTPALKSYLKLLKQMNFQLIIATGRTFGEVKTIVEPGLFDAYICSNAMSIYTDKQERIKHLTLSAEIIPSILEEASTHEIYYELRQDVGPGCVQPAHLGYMENMLTAESCETVSVHEWHSRKNAISKLKAMDKNDINQAVKIYFFHPNPKQLAVWRKTLKQIIVAYPISIESSSNNSCEIVHEQASKGLGLQALVEMGVTKKEQIICFGDSFNDVSMFQYAAYRVAMKNGHDQLKAIADEVTDYTNDENGVLRWIVKHIKE